MQSNDPEPVLRRAGYYISPQGGAPSPSHIPEGMLLVELLTKGRVLHPGSEIWAEVGTVFLHGPRQSTVHQSPGGIYECLTASFEWKGGEPPASVLPRSFYWPDPAGVESFSREVLHAAHYEEMDLSELGTYVWSTLMFRLSAYRKLQTRQKMPGPVALAVEALQSNPGKDWNLRALAKEAGWSTSHLHAEFKRVTGKSPHQYLTAQRMAEARHRLVRSRDPIKEIAYDVGFSNTENFCRVFRRIHGQTAGTFRMNYQILSQDV